MTEIIAKGYARKRPILEERVRPRLQSASDALALQYEGQISSDPRNPQSKKIIKKVLASGVVL
jgi:hypothetical protein